MSQAQELNTVVVHRPAASAAFSPAAAWPLAAVMALFDLPFNDLRFQAQRANFPAGDVELATLLSIKTGGCEEDCGYCPQAAEIETLRPDGSARTIPIAAFHRLPGRPPY